MEKYILKKTCLEGCISTKKQRRPLLAKNGTDKRQNGSQTVEGSEGTCAGADGQVTQDQVSVGTHTRAKPLKRPGWCTEDRVTILPLPESDQVTLLLLTPMMTS